MEDLFCAVGLPAGGVGLSDLNMFAYSNKIFKTNKSNNLKRLFDFIF
jgi:hypothetical protein